MENRPGRPTVGHAISTFVVEGEIRKRGGETTFDVVISLSGREGTFHRSWRLVSGRPDDKQLVDIASFVSGYVTGSVECTSGVQGSL